MGGSQGAKIFGEIVPPAMKMIKNNGYEIEVNQHLIPTEETDIVLGIRRAINGLESHFTFQKKEIKRL